MVRDGLCGDAMSAKPPRPRCADEVDSAAQELTAQGQGVVAASQLMNYGRIVFEEVGVVYHCERSKHWWTSLKWLASKAKVNMRCRGKKLQKLTCELLAGKKLEKLGAKVNMLTAVFERIVNKAGLPRMSKT
jgi:hypothetical protein